MHIEAVSVPLNIIANANPQTIGSKLRTVITVLLVIGAFSLIYGFSTLDPKLFWASYYVSLMMFMGVAAGSIIIPCIFQITGAKWSTSIRRLAEANIAFLPIAFLLWCISFFGRESLYPWARFPMPGREYWMQDWFVYARFFILLAILFLIMWRFVKMSLRADIGFLRDNTEKNNQWHDAKYNSYVSDWKGSAIELPKLQEKLSYSAPPLVILYALIYSLFVYETIIAMDIYFGSNLYGAFIFCGNIFMGWISLYLCSAFLAKRNEVFRPLVGRQQYWDLGKLTFGFTMIWGYMMFSQFLPYWYANLPETSPWMITRTREWPWKGVSYFTFACCFVIPFVLLMSRDVKRTPTAYAIVATIILIGLWFEKYITIMPQMTPTSLPLSIVDFGIMCGFLGLYLLSINKFLEKFPFVCVARVVKESPMFPKEEH